MHDLPTSLRQYSPFSIVSWDLQSSSIFNPVMFYSYLLSPSFRHCNVVLAKYEEQKLGLSQCYSRVFTVGSIMKKCSLNGNRLDLFVSCHEIAALYTNFRMKQATEASTQTSVLPLSRLLLMNRNRTTCYRLSNIVLRKEGIVKWPCCRDLR